MKNLIDISEVNFDTEAKTLKDIRKIVFIHEQEVPEEEEWDEWDAHPSTVHLLARTKEGKAVSCLRIVHLPDDSIKITRLAVLKEFRRQGIALALLKHAMKTTLSSSFKRIFLHAQVSAIDLYQKLGFESEGEQFLEAGIVHQTMVFKPENAEYIEQIYENSVERLSYANEFLHHLIRCSQLGYRQLFISSLRLRSDIFSQQDFIDAISDFARKDRQANIKILIQDTQHLREQHSPLVELARRLPSKIHVHAMQKDVEAIDSFMCVDKKHLVYFNDEDKLVGFCSYRAGPESKTLVEKFEHAWSHLSEVDPNLKQVSL